MSVHNVINAEQHGNARGGHALQFDADNDFSQNLRIGEIIKGKVTRHFDGSRYAVNFGGSERVVDSAMPLTRGELLYGRVIGLNDKVHLQRVFHGQSNEAREPREQNIRSDNQAMLEDMFAKYQARLTASIKTQVLPLMKSHHAPLMIARSSLILSRLGLPSEPVLVRAVGKALEEEKLAIQADRVRASPALRADGEPALRFDAGMISDFAAVLAMLSEPRTTYLPPDRTHGDDVGVDDAVMQNVMTEDASGNGDHGGRRDRDGQLGHWVLNVQSTGSVSHRLARLPIWFGDDLIEVEVAMFSQRESTVKTENVRHRKIVMSLTIEGLGQVDVSVYAAGRHLRLHFAAEGERESDFLAAHYGDIRSVVEELGWIIDEVRYVVQPIDQERPVQSVAEHYISNDSLNRVM